MQLSVCANNLSIFGGCSNVCASRCKVFFLFSRDINELTIAATTGTTQTTATSTAASARTTPIILTEANANVKYQMQAMTPFDDFVYLVNHVLLGEEPTIEDFILLVGTLVAFIAFILWCCFPIQPKDANNHRQFSCKTLHKQQQQQQNATESMAPTGGSSSSGASGGTFGTANISGRYGVCVTATGNDNDAINSGCGNNATCADSSNNYSRSEPTMSVHNDYIKNGHHCCT